MQEQSTNRVSLYIAAMYNKDNFKLLNQANLLYLTTTFLHWIVSGEII